MAELPVSYMKAVRDLTGFWAAYPLGQELAPGSYGQRVNGRFIKDGELADFPGFDAQAFATRTAPSRSPADAWLSEGATVERLGVGVDGPALPVAGHLRLRFSQAEQAAFLCRKPREWSFTSLGLVKAHLVRLYQQNLWEPKDILITHVMKASEAWLFYASQSGQSVDLSLSVTPGPAVAAELLKAAVGSGELEIGYGGLASSGYSSTLDKPGTPLFQAIKIKRFPNVHADIVTKGGGDVFELATFGDSDSDSDDET